MSEENTKIYLSGPMSGYKDFNFPAFARAAENLRSTGYEVFNPAEQGFGKGDPENGSSTEDEYLSFLRADVRAVTECDEIATLPGWEKSRGATLEVEVGRRLGLRVYDYLELGDRSYVLNKQVGAAPPAESVLQEADRLVSTDRQEDYGHPLDDFSKVVGMAKALWGRGPETPQEHALYMVMVKLARESNRPKRDNRVDVAGYIKTLDLVIEEQERRTGRESDSLTLP